jgi:hypothetical protein
MNNMFDHRMVRGSLFVEAGAPSLSGIPDTLHCASGIEECGSIDRSMLVPSCMDQAQSAYERLKWTVNAYPEEFTDGKVLAALRIFEKAVSRHGVLLIQLGLTRAKVFHEIRDIVRRRLEKS